MAAALRRLGGPWLDEFFLAHEKHFSFARRQIAWMRSLPNHEIEPAGHSALDARKHLPPGVPHQGAPKQHRMLTQGSIFPCVESLQVQSQMSGSHVE